MIGIDDVNFGDVVSVQDYEHILQLVVVSIDNDGTLQCIDPNCSVVFKYMPGTISVPLSAVLVVNEYMNSITRGEARIVAAIYRSVRKMYDKLVERKEKLGMKLYKEQIEHGRK